VEEIHSDIPFLLVSTVSVLLIGRLVVERRRLISPVWDQVLLGATMAAAYFFRTNGLLLLVTLGITQGIALMGRVYGHAASPEQSSAGSKRVPSTTYAAVRPLHLHILPHVSFVSFVLVWQAVLPDGGISQAYVMGEVSMGLLKQHVHYYLDLPAAFFERVPHAHLLYGATLPLAMAGAMRRSRADYHAVIYILLTFLLYILWPRGQGLRFLFPVLPFYLSFVLSCLGTYDASMVAPGRVPRKVICLLPIVLVLLYFGTGLVRDAVSNLVRNRAPLSGPFVETSRSMFAYIERHTEPESTVVFFKPRAMRMMTGRRSVLINTVDRLSLGDYMCLYRRDEAARYQISPDDVRRLAATGIMQEVYRNRDFVVYRLPECENTASRMDGRCAALQAQR
jgi:hypothetical protein